MRVIAKGQLLALSGTQCYSWTDVLEWILKKIEFHGPETKLKIDFCGEYIPFDECHAELVAQLTTAYHNSSVRDNVTGSSGKNPYEPYQEMDAKFADDDAEEALRESDEEDLEGSDCWDEERDGEQQVYDAEYEKHEELVPWNMMQRRDWAEEKYGFYT